MCPSATGRNYDLYRAQRQRGQTRVESRPAGCSYRLSVLCIGDQQHREVRPDAPRVSIARFEQGAEAELLLFEALELAIHNSVGEHALGAVVGNPDRDAVGPDAPRTAVERVKLVLRQQRAAGQAVDEQPSLTLSTTYITVPSDQIPRGSRLRSSSSRSRPGSRAPSSSRYAKSWSWPLSAIHTTFPSDQMPVGFSFSGSSLSRSRVTFQSKSASDGTGAQARRLEALEMRSRPQSRCSMRPCLAGMKSSMPIASGRGAGWSSCPTR